MSDRPTTVMLLTADGHISYGVATLPVEVSTYPDFIVWNGCAFKWISGFNSGADGTYQEVVALRLNVGDVR